MWGRDISLDTLAAQSGPSEGPSSAFRQLIYPHLDAAYNLARYIVGDAAAAEDITQDAMLRAYRGLDRLRGETVKPWLMAIVRNACADHRRRNRPWKELARGSLDETAAAVADPNAEHPEAAAIRHGDIAALRSAIQALPERLRITIVLRELEEFSYRDIAQATKVPLGTVMSRLARARARLAVAFHGPPRGPVEEASPKWNAPLPTRGPTPSCVREPGGVGDSLKDGRAGEVVGRERQSPKEERPVDHRRAASCHPLPL